MPRKMIVQTQEGSMPVLEESLAKDEAQLQELVKNNPDLLPIEEFGMTGPLMVVGRETILRSGAVDLVALARSGELLVIEFKTGPQNTDFRHALVQLLDYGSDLWGMSYDDFESTVAVRYFTNERCQGTCVEGKRTLTEAADAMWPDLSEEEAAHIQDRLSQQLANGAFHYVLVAQRFTHTIERSIEYLNAAMREARFYAVELVCFVGDDLSAFESRTVLGPTTRTGSTGQARTSETDFLQAIHDEEYREALRWMFEACRGLGLHTSWGTIGVSIRVPTADRPEPLSIAWLYPPNRIGWMGLTDLTLGFDPSSAKNTPSALPALEQYVSAVSKLTSAEPVKSQSPRGYRFNPEATILVRREIVELIAQLVRQINAAE